jgi:DNA-binding CsgD family transcriptional regulator/tetratricopeptide (TPR) repeat protein
MRASSVSHLASDDGYGSHSEPHAMGANPPYFATAIPKSAPPMQPITDNHLAMELLERQQQLETLNGCLQAARAGNGKLVLIAGEAGLGKSSLVEQFVSEPARGTYALWGACDELATPRALGPVHDIAAQTQMFAGQRMSHEESRDRLFRALLDELARPELGCVVVLEDMHWADEATIEFVRFIGRRIQRTSALFLVTYRDDELSVTHPVRLALGELTGHHVIRMRLPPLSAAAVKELAKDSTRDAAQLHQITGGNPFFIREVLASPDESVPETVRDAVLARLMRCSAPTRELAELLSMSPAKTAQWLIESVIGVSQTAIDEGVRRGLLVAQSDAVGFRHALARLAVHSTVPAERARAMHEQLLQALVKKGADLAELVHHATLANNAAAVLKYAPLAAKEAARVGAHRESAANLSAALGYSASLPIAMHAQLLEMHAEECSLMNKTASAIASASEALALWRSVANIEAQSRVASFLAPEYRMTGDKMRADECVANAIALLQPLPHSMHLAAAYAARSRLASNRGQDKEAIAFAQRALELAHEFGDRSIEALALNYIGTTLLIAGDLSGYEPLAHSLALALEFDLPECAARAYANFVFCCTLGHDFVRADQYLHTGLAYCEQRQMFSNVAYIRAYESRLALDRGEWTEAARIAAELLPGTELLPVHRVPTLLTLALVRTRRGDTTAEDLLNESFELALPMGEPERVGRVAAARAEHAWYLGDLEGMTREVATGLQHLADLRFPWLKGELLWWQSRAGVVSQIPDDIAEPYRLLLVGDWRAAADTWGTIGMPYEQALALAEGSDAALREALAILDRLGAGPLAAIVRRRLRERGVRGIPRGPNESTRANPAGLTAKEAGVLALLAQGCTNTQLARKLHRSPKTIEHHVSAILEKLGVHSRTEAVAAAFELGIVTAQKDAETRRPA